MQILLLEQPEDRQLQHVGYFSASMYRSDISNVRNFPRKLLLRGSGRVRDVLSPRSLAQRRAGAGPEIAGQVDYRLSRNLVVSEFRKGRLSRQDVCDAHPELLRAAANIGEEVREDCPICEASKVGWCPTPSAAGSRLRVPASPPHGS